MQHRRDLQIEGTLEITLATYASNESGARDRMRREKYTGNRKRKNASRRHREGEKTHTERCGGSSRGGGRWKQS
jgi:hypothetical protein